MREPGQHPVLGLHTGPASPSIRLFRLHLMAAAIRIPVMKLMGPDLLTFPQINPFCNRRKIHITKTAKPPGAGPFSGQYTCHGICLPMRVRKFLLKIQKASALCKNRHPLFCRLPHGPAHSLVAAQGICKYLRISSPQQKTAGSLRKGAVFHGAEGNKFRPISFQKPQIIPVIKGKGTIPGHSNLHGL